MKATCTTQIAITFLLLALVACTDSRTPTKTQGSRLSRAVPQTITLVGNLSDNGNDISVYQMLSIGTSIYLTGAGNSTPSLGFAKWDILASPELPNVIFQTSQQIDSFGNETDLKWRPDNFASGALAIMGTSWAYMSGNAGMSVVDLSDGSHPKEKVRFPAASKTEIEINRDINYVYKALVAHPSLPLLYGFKENDFQYTLAADGAKVKILSKNPYKQAGETVCCVTGATVFQNQIYVAFTHALWIFKLGSNGELAELTIDDNFQATGITSTPDKLYILHQPGNNVIGSSGVRNPAGIYVFDAIGDQANYLPIEPYVFTVSPNNMHLYANMDETSVAVYRINWNQASR